MYCPNCGTKISDNNSNFCTNCGYSIKSYNPDANTFQQTNEVKPVRLVEPLNNNGGKAKADVRVMSDATLKCLIVFGALFLSFLLYVLFNSFVLSKNTSNAEKLYYSIATELSTAKELENNYFADKYDMKEFKAAVNNAQVALDNSDEAAYKSVLADLQTQNKAFSSFIDSRVKEVYNSTTGNATDQYPFKVDISELPESWDFKPVILQSSDNPTWIITRPPKTTDDKAYMCLFVGVNSAEYSYDVSNIETRRIRVQDENGKETEALVNTEVKIAVNKGFNYINEAAFYSSNPAYLLKNKSGNILFAIKCRDEGSDYYILYK